MNVFDEIIESVHAEPGRGVAVRWLMSPANLRECSLLTSGAAAERRLLREAEAFTFGGVPVVVDPTRELPALIVEQAIDETALKRRDEALPPGANDRDEGGADLSPRRRLDDGLVRLVDEVDKLDALVFEVLPEERDALVGIRGSLRELLRKVIKQEFPEPEPGVDAHHARRYEAMFLESAARNLNHIRQALAAGEVEKALGMATELEESIRGRQSGLVGT